MPFFGCDRNNAGTTVRIFGIAYLSGNPVSHTDKGKKHIPINFRPIFNPAEKTSAITGYNANLENKCN